MGDKQKEYSVEYKREAVRLMETSGKSAVQIARALGVTASVLYHWRKILAEKGEQAFPGKGHQREAEEELRRLGQENERLKQERDNLKKSHSHLQAEPNVKFQFIYEHKDEFVVRVMCKGLVVSESG